MKRAIDERGPIAAWLIRCRAQFREPNAERTWTVATFLAAADTGWAPTRTTYARWESGATRPEPENLRRVEAFYAGRGIDGPAGPLAATGATEPADALIAAISAQTAAITALVAELQREREEGRDVVTAFDRAAEHLLSSLRPVDTGGSGGRSALRETAQ